MEALRLWTPYSRWKYREPHEYPARVCRKAPVAKLSCEAATEENAKRRSFMPRTQVTGKANFSPRITSGLPVILPEYAIRERSLSLHVALVLRRCKRGPVARLDDTCRLDPWRSNGWTT